MQRFRGLGYEQERNAIRRLSNVFGAAEGSLLPPVQIGPSRVPVVSGLQVVSSSSFLGGTQFTLSWEVPFGTSNVGYFLVSVENQDGATAAQQAFQVTKSPAIIKVTSAAESTVTFRVQTVLRNGQASDLRLSPTVSARTIAPVITDVDIGQETTTKAYFPSRAISSDVLITDQESYVFRVDASATRYITIPRASDVPRVIYHFKSVAGSSVINVSPSSGTIDGATTYSFSGFYNTIMIYAVEQTTEWIVLIQPA